MYVTNRPELVFTEGQGMWLTDHNGKRYLDFLQGWAVNTLGHAPQCIADALAAQSKKLINPARPSTTALIELAGLLTANSVFDRVFFANSGAEANEGAIKLARKWGKKNPAAGALRDHHLRPQLPRPHPGHHVGLRQGRLGHHVRPAGAGLPKAILNDIASVEALITDTPWP
jgi:acetylornithine/N-succinyldiaminopimelate aminotransferase